MCEHLSDTKIVPLSLSGLTREIRYFQGTHQIQTVLSVFSDRPSDTELPPVKTTFICHSCQDTSDKQDNYTIIAAMSGRWTGWGEREKRGEEGRAGADSRLGVLLCVAMFRISSPRRLRTNPWRLLPHSWYTSFRQTDRSEFSSPNIYSKTKKRNPKRHAYSSVIAKKNITLMFLKV